MSSAPCHTTVLREPAVDALLARAGPAPAGTWVDATFGRGGHTRLILCRLGPQGRLVAFDKDPEAIAEAMRITDARFSIRHQGFGQLGQLPAGSLAGVLMDLGVSSPQIDSPERGFSFRFDGPLDMRMDTTRGLSAADWLATADAGQIAQVLRDYGEERFAGLIAKAIVVRRQARGPLARTAELADLVAGAVKTREPGQNPATRTFQALRIFINAELEELQQALAASLLVLQPGGRLVVLSFHSLEDRIVKQFIARHSRQPFDRRVPFAAPQAMQLLALARVRPDAAEVAANPRARSAIMRVAERTQAHGAERSDMRRTERPDARRAEHGEVLPP
ncbi:16S rRNA (cytosine(1402)-N(4))-methyltransferase RsmH [Verminephrobacter eiseniae]|uniref:16S rRNA (cytosine(1402)-N(4))-methyltransferase RsmH n=1 Tax=Verminephrobacter eiseniae TaxID=364317 RepID=UPI0022383FAF|nr:16S rRNA (cytosine(1402)-N(4))-methyltransferase RsmH [Verminephrobacter eiseniae]MCW5230302.1 16S rRNA (cytosine(1402)-N(4))-methyltransferase RsmH [Verminephrobacter eiseniae]MCW5292036.1 16S rRNA (cytosine(1402)-N(4))-methyltransferase RsmH [Verminephrobacter eiseniae]MCW8187747.1 16S rRNA (cytosine(1402)-N(4))-methyltransferase RsmH [Verminephrobacter eiseniae]MCW8226019.1 16S rRNA (cytosine(1402)-N(4))-methyltransferase RsmH [Verminephrobacter eiseniae]MCW8236464.1 16S rRNA (cytosine(1